MAIARLAVLTRNALADQFKTRIDLGAGAGTIKIYTGTQPATGDTALSGNTLLGTLTCTDPSAAGASSGVLTLSAITQDSSADNSGTATWARVQDSDGNNVVDVDVTATGGGGSLQLNTTTIAAGGPIGITAFTITVPAS